MRFAISPPYFWLTTLTWLLATPVLGQSSKVWVPAGTGSWFTTSNWSPQGVPGPSSVSEIYNGGTANADTGTSNVFSNRIEVGKNAGTGTLNINGRTVSVGTDIDVGQIGSDFTGGSNTYTSIGTATISNSASVQVGTLGAGHIDVASTGADSNAISNGTGNLTINTTTLVSVTDDFNIGQTTTTASGARATSNGTVNITGLGTLTIGGDLDVAQSGGTGRSMANAAATIRTVTNPITIGLSLVVGRTTGSTNSAGNSGNGSVTFSDAGLNVGFGSASNPGSVVIGDVIASGTRRGNAFGQVTLERVALNVKTRIDLGELSGGGTNTASTTDGTLSLVDSSVSTPQLDIANVVSNTAGTAHGKLSLNPSLVNVTGATTLGVGSELVFALAGTTRAAGISGPGQYSALNTAAATLKGKLTIVLAGGFAPSLGNQFRVISATAATGVFDSIVLPTLGTGLAWGVTTNSAGVLLTVNTAPPGDYNGNGTVDGADYVVWRNNGGTASEYNKWRANFGRTSGSGSSLPAASSVPEPSAVLIVLIGMLPPWAFVAQRMRASGAGRCGI